jgi:predicted amidohydrolase
MKIAIYQGPGIPLDVAANIQAIGMQPYDFVASHMVPMRAFENQVFVAYANRCANENGLDYIGLSCVAGPDGRDLARAGRDEALIFAELDRELLDQWRQVNTYLQDRNPSLYGPLTESKGESE